MRPDHYMLFFTRDQKQAIEDYINVYGNTYLRAIISKLKEEEKDNYYYSEVSPNSLYLCIMELKYRGEVQIRQRLTELGKLQDGEFFINLESSQREYQKFSNMLY
jgi:recombinational DNA repair protein (RecF pathway)